MSTTATDFDLDKMLAQMTRLQRERDGALAKLQTLGVVLDHEERGAASVVNLQRVRDLIDYQGPADLIRRRTPR